MAEGYQRIYQEWAKGTSMTDLCHLLQKWMTKYRPQDAMPALAPLITLFLERANSEDPTHLVEDFMYGDTFRPFHRAFGK